MKKIISVLLVAVIICALLTACGAPTLEGTWSTTINGDKGQMTLYSDGNGEIVSNGETRPCTWTATEDTLTVIQEVAGIPFVFLDNVTYTLKGRTLTVTSQSGNTLVFKRKK